MQLEWLNTLKPNFKVLPLKERMLCGLGALLGLALSSFISWWLLGGVRRLILWREFLRIKK
jgi:CBS domain-containing membrane protein